ncbi:MAG: sigma-70 family RNA polymerase sigma factor [Acidimicrobiia bacterium]|nr:sigma-70 family RNA polymerase sigma factor [Acidimicrobiia bacterium]MYG73317.1 sigma-70 family RNA polymerase sigma factor [Acidimicrobiia bacterium]MYH95224.1 sigma-70 family RNA polymerase sigma factor [Acidimicrobiia bacterium]
MAVPDEPRPDEWVVGDDIDAQFSLFKEVGDALRSGARRGIREVVKSVPTEHDVEEVAVQSFNELWRKDQSSVRSPAGLAYRIAYRRGVDRGRRLLRERRRDRAVGTELLDTSHQVSDLDEADFAETMAVVQRCKDHLTVEQREVISATVEGTVDGTMPLKEFAEERGTTYEACRRMLKRGIDALAKCVKAALGSGVG